jgi:hypothetical protein
VAIWRSLRRLGAVTLTPGAAILPYTEHLLEQLEWIAEEVVQNSGDAYVLPVTDLPEADEADLRRRMRTERDSEFGRLKESARTLAAGKTRKREQERQVATLQRRLDDATGRDYFDSRERGRAERAIARARQGLERAAD